MWWFTTSQDLDTLYHSNWHISSGTTLLLQVAAVELESIVDKPVTTVTCFPDYPGSLEFDLMSASAFVLRTRHPRNAPDRPSRIQMELLLPSDEKTHQRMMIDC